LKKKSKFIGYTAGVSSEDEAKQFTNGISKEENKTDWRSSGE